MFLHKQNSGTSRVHRYMVNAMADLGVRVRNVGGAQATVDRLPRRAAIVRSERASRRDGDEHSDRVLRIQNNRVQAQPAGAGLPQRPGAVATESRNFMPGMSAIRRAEQCRIFYSGIDFV